MAETIEHARPTCPCRPSLDDPAALLRDARGVLERNWLGRFHRARCIRTSGAGTVRSSPSAAAGTISDVPSVKSEWAWLLCIDGKVAGESRFSAREGE